MTQATADRITLHATSVAISGRGLLILGTSGAGKSALALDLMSRGAGLVSDDRCLVWCEGGRLIVDAPDTLRGRIEARGVGILSAPALGPVPIALVVDLDQSETDRLPACHETEILGISLPLARNCTAPHFSAALMTYVKGGRVD